MVGDGAGQVRMLPTSVLTNRQTAQSFLAHLLPPLLRRMGLYLALQGLLLCNKLGLLAHYYTAQVRTDTVALLDGAGPLRCRLACRDSVRRVVHTCTACHHCAPRVPRD